MDLREEVMKKLIFILKILCACLCVSSLILMVGVANLTQSQDRFIFYSTCEIIAVAMFVSFKLLGKIERGTRFLKHIDIEYLKEAGMNERSFKLIIHVYTGKRKGHHVFSTTKPHVDRGEVVVSVHKNGWKRRYRPRQEIYGNN